MKGIVEKLGCLLNFQYAIRTRISSREAKGPKRTPLQSNTTVVPEWVRVHETRGDLVGEVQIGTFIPPQCTKKMPIAVKRFRVVFGISNDLILYPPRSFFLGCFDSHRIRMYMLDI